MKGDDTRALPPGRMTSGHRRARLLLLLLPVWLIGCRPETPDPLQDLPPLEGRSTDPSRLPTPPATRPARVCLSHILVSYHGALQAWKKIKIDRSGARSRAKRLLQLARSKGMDFAELARRFSNDAETSQNGGDLGVVVPGMLHPALEAAGFSLGIGQVADLVESPRGFHILMRTKPSEAQAAEIVISYEGAHKYRPRQPRGYGEARKLAESIHARLLAGEDFGELARRYSDLGNFRRSGIYPIFRRGSRNPEFEKVVWGLEVGQLSAVIETTTGFHIVKRLPARRMAIRLIKIGYAQSDQKEKSSTGRTRSEARQLADELYRRATTGGEDFAALASRYSQGRGSNKGGLVDRLGRGQLPPALDRLAISTPIGKVSEVIEENGAFFLLKRVY